MASLDTGSAALAAVFHAHNINANVIPGKFRMTTTRPTAKLLFVGAMRTRAQCPLPSTTPHYAAHAVLIFQQWQAAATTS
jgi:hypothetical protein